MNFPKIIAGALFIGSLAVGGVALAGPSFVKSQIDGFRLASNEEGHGGAQGGKAVSGAALDMQALIQRLSQNGYGDIRKIEREGGRYEVEARNRDGRWRELEIDAQSGKILRDEEDD